jgi:predicted GIY-YIG superfamily endonuclease
VSGITLYLIHIEPRYKHAGHYLGVTRRDRPPAIRLEEHRSGAGAILTRYAKNAGCELILARTWHNVPFQMEKRLKGRGLAPLCPICRGAQQ